MRYIQSLTLVRSFFNSKYPCYSSYLFPQRPALVLSSRTTIVRWVVRFSTPPPTAHNFFSTQSCFSWYLIFKLSQNNKTDVKTVHHCSRSSTGSSTRYTQKIAYAKIICYAKIRLHIFFKKPQVSTNTNQCGQWPCEMGVQYQVGKILISSWHWVWCGHIHC